MISKESFSKAWLEKQRKYFPKADPQLIERQIYAFELVGLFAKSNKPFVFKGGSSLILLLPEPRRLSIDVDIVGDFVLDELIQLSAGTVFSRVEEDSRSESNVPKKHFKLYYQSAIDGREAYVMLDVLYSEHGYSRLRSLPIKSAIFNADEEIKVSVPSVDAILGDKLTAFAPHTTGVPFRRKKSMEIIKQLFDIGELFDHCVDIGEVTESYETIQEQESKYRATRPSLVATLDDTIETSFLLCQTRLKGSIKDNRTDELDLGIRQIQSYLLGSPFRIEEARVAASKAAFIATAMKAKHTDVVLNEIKYSTAKLKDVENAMLEGKLSILNKLKATQTETFYYWWLISRLR